MTKSNDPRSLGLVICASLALVAGSLAGQTGGSGNPQSNAKCRYVSVQQNDGSWVNGCEGVTCGGECVKKLIDLPSGGTSFRCDCVGG